MQFATALAPVPTVDASPRVTLPPVVLENLFEEGYHVMLWQVSGESEIVTDGTAHRLTAGLALWVPTRTRHSIMTGAGSVLLPMFFEPAATVAVLRAPTVIFVDDDLRTLCFAFVQTSYSIIRPAADIPQQILGLIDERHHGVAALPMPRSGDAAIVAAALRSNPADGRSVVELARSVHTSTRTIERAFRAETGMTLRRWRLENRMRAAAALLRTPRAVIDAVARHVGYTDPSAFRRAFKAAVGVPPGEYAQRFRDEA